MGSPPTTPPRVMRGASAGADGAAGYVPGFPAGSESKMLRLDGTAATIPLNYLGGVAGASVPATATTKADFYLITSAGTSQSKTWAIGDLAVYEGTSGAWTKIVGALPTATTSVPGAVQLAGDSAAVAGTSDALVPTVDDAARLALAGFHGYDTGTRNKVYIPTPRDQWKAFNNWLGETPNGLNLGRNLTVGDQRNIWRYTENLGHASYSVGGSFTKGTDTVTVDGIVLTKITGNNFYDGLWSNVAGLGLAPYTTGEYYIASCFVLSVQDHEQWPGISRGGGSDTNNSFERKLLEPGKLKRIWGLYRATSTSALDKGALGTVAYGSGAGGFPYWLTNSYADGGSGFSNSINAYVGGFQIEKVTSDGKYGIAVIGDSIEEGSSGGVDSANSLEWPSQLSGHLNVHVFNRGVGGNQTSTMDGRWATDITPLAARCKYVIIKPSAANDIPNGVSLASIQASVNSMVAKAATDALIPVIVVPASTSSIDANGTYRTTYDSLCTWIRQTFPLNIDFALALNDPLNGYQLARRTLISGDGIHPGTEGKRIMGRVAAMQPYWDFPRPSPYQAIATTTYTAPSLYLWDTATSTIKAVSLGAADSGGTGYKTLRVAN